MKTTAFCAMFLVACSESETTPVAATDTGTAPVDTAVTDTGTPVVDSAVVDSAAMDAVPDAASFPTCGMAPYVMFYGVVRSFGLAGTMPLPTAKLTSPTCGTTEYPVASSGAWGVRLTKDSTGYTKVEAPDHIPLLLGEWKASRDANADINMFPTAIQSLFPDWKMGEAAILTVVNPEVGTTGACAEKDGVTITIKDQPTAKVGYLSTGMPPSVVAGATATTKSGAAIITNVTGPWAELIVTKAGCSAALAGSNTGRTPVIAPNLTGYGLAIKN